MDSELIMPLFSLLGTLAGTFGGIVASSRLTNYRIQTLEKKVDKHNNVIERTYILEEKIKVVNHRLEDLEEKHR